MGFWKLEIHAGQFNKGLCFWTLREYALGHNGISFKSNKQHMALREHVSVYSVLNMAERCSTLQEGRADKGQTQSLETLDIERCIIKMNSVVA